jgi:hypothetical protein
MVRAAMRRLDQWYVRHILARSRVTERRLAAQTGAALVGAAATAFFCARAIEDTAYLVGAVAWAAWTLVWLTKLRRSLVFVMGEVMDARDDRLNDRLAELHAEWKPIEAIKAIKTELGVSLAEAKQYLHGRPEWRADLDKWDKVLDEVERDVHAEGHL